MHQELVDHFVEEVPGGKFLLGEIVMCERDFGHDCLNVFKHIEKNLEESEGSDARVEAFDEFRSLLDDNLDDEHLIHSPRAAGSMARSPSVVCGATARSAPPARM